MASSSPPSSSYQLSHLVAQPSFLASSSMEVDRCEEQDETKRAPTFPAQADEEEESSKYSQHLHLILDSGAAHHVTSDRSLLSDFVTPAGSAAAYHARDGRVLPIAGSGAVAGEKFNLNNVLYVPLLIGATVIVVSVKQLAERDYLVMFGGGQCYVKDPCSGSLLGKGRLHDDGLYHLEFLRTCTDGATDGTDSSTVA